MATVKPVPEGFHTVTPAVTVEGCAEAIETWKKAFGAEEITRAPDPSGKKVWHAALRIGNSMIFASDAAPEMGNQASKTKLWLYRDHAARGHVLGRSHGLRHRPLGQPVDARAACEGHDACGDEEGAGRVRRADAEAEALNDSTARRAGAGRIACSSCARSFTSCSSDTPALPSESGICSVTFRRGSSEAEKKMKLNEILQVALRGGASDIHLKAGLPPMFRVDGSLVPLKDARRLPAEEIARMAYGIMNDYQKEKFKAQNELDLAYGVPGLGRFRVNCFQQRGTIGVVLRVIPFKINSIEQLLLPKILEKIAGEQRGLILVTGTTGSGKSTTLASMVDHINTNETC